MLVTSALTRSCVPFRSTALPIWPAAEAGAREESPPSLEYPWSKQRPDRAGDGQYGRRRTELFQRHRSDRILHSDAPTLRPISSRKRFFVRVTQGLSRLLQQLNATLRVPGRSALRPDPASTQVCDLDRSALHYYVTGRAHLGSAPR